MPSALPAGPGFAPLISATLVPVPEADVPMPWPISMYHSQRADAARVRLVYDERICVLR